MSLGNRTACDFLPAVIKEWSQRSTNRKIFLAAAVVGGMTLVVKAVALLKDLVVAQQLGVSSDLDAYLIAFILPQFAINVTAGALQTSLVPTFIEVRDREGDEAAQELFSAVIARALLILVGCVLLFGVIGPLVLPIIGSGFDAHTFELSRNMFYMTLPAIIISGMGVIWGAILNAYDRFALAAVAPGAVPLLTIVLLVLTIQQLGVYALALGLIAGFTAQAVLMAWSLRQHHLSLLPRWRTRPEFSHYVRQVMLQFAPAAAGAVLASSTNLVDQAMATPLGAGSVSALNYGSKLLSFIIGVGATALGISILPHFSKMVAEQDWAKVRHTFRTYALLIVGATLPLVAIFTIFSEPIIRLLYQRGAFTAQDTVLVSQIQAALFFSFRFIC